MKKSVIHIVSFLTIILFTGTYAFSGEDLDSNSKPDPITVNVGYMSEYWIRGSFQAASVSHASINYTSDPIYISAGWADLRDRKGTASYNEGEGFISLYGTYNFQLSSMLLINYSISLRFSYSYYNILFIRSYKCLEYYVCSSTV